MGTSWYDLESSSLRFDSVQDTQNYLADLVQSSHDWLAVNDLDVVKRYKERELEIVIECSSRSKLNKYHLVFRSIPDVWLRHREEPSATNISSVWPQSLPYWDNHFVLIGVGDFVQSPKEIIPSLVRLESAKERVDFLRNILGSPKIISHFSDVSGEGKSTMLGVFNSRGKSECVSRVIENTSQTDSDICSFIRDARGDGLCHPDFFENVSRFLRMQLSNSLVGVLVTESVDLLLEFNKVFLSPSNFLARTLERV